MVQVAVTLDHSALRTRCPKRMWRSMPYSAIVSRRYAMIDWPSAIAFSAFHGLNSKPSVCMSLSERTPG